MSARSGCAESILEVIPRVMDSLRSEMRLSADAHLTVPQFRVLVRLAKQSTTHKELAAWIGVTLPTLSKMVEVLVEKELVTQQPLPGDRRKSILALTPKGRRHYESYRSKVKKRLEEKLIRISGAEVDTLCEALTVLGRLFTSPKVTS